MSQAAIIQLAEEVKDDLNKKQGGWSWSFQAERVYYPVTNFEDTDQLLVHVAPAGWTKTPDSRSEWQHTFIIEIGLQYRPSPKAGNQAKEKFDDLMRLAEQISDHYEDTRPTLADCVLSEVAFGPGGSGQPFVPEHAESLNQFTGVIRLTFQKWR